MLVVGIKVGSAVDQNPHLSMSTVSHSRRNQNASERMNIDFFAVERKVRVILTLQNHVNLGVFSMVMLDRVTSDLGQVNGSWNIFTGSKGAPGGSARACLAGQLGQVDDLCSLGPRFVFVVDIGTRVADFAQRSAFFTDCRGGYLLARCEGVERGTSRPMSQFIPIVRDVPRSHSAGRY